MFLVRSLLFPFSFIYGLVVILRNCAYDIELFRSRKFKIPVISIGNLTVGGAGKTPMTEYLVNLLKNEFDLATLSRGYGRKTKGFIVVTANSTSIEVGDEPRQFKQKFPDVTVSVCEDRCEGIKRLSYENELIILDDAYQHRAVKPGLSLLLYDYTQMFRWQWFLPTGNLREPLYGRKRAQVIVVSKTPCRIDELQKQKILKKINPYPHQKVFFSCFNYKSLISINHPLRIRKIDSISSNTKVLLLTGIANPKPLLQELNKYTQLIEHHKYPDHHNFSEKNIIKLVSDFRGYTNEDKLVITTEKDLQRLKTRAIKDLIEGIDIYYLPVEVKIHEPDEDRFIELIKDYATKYTTDYRIHKKKNW
ncbi:MAG: tetraacyldisaccharide 4-kinase [Sphingobacteriales bacterium]|nr:tetraacyldisaccharide 4-kinase [Sphingobacteriales bacterium]